MKYTICKLCGEQVEVGGICPQCSTKQEGDG